MSPTTAPPAWNTLPNAPAPGSVLGHLAALDDGAAAVHTWPDTSAQPDKPFRYLLTRSGAQVRAFVNRCAHFGVPLAQTQEHLRSIPHQRITCNVHYAHYGWNDGRCLGGECAGEGLLPIPVQVRDDGSICVSVG
ncbi:MAG: Rieske (2Fe-2S) protein [Rhodoferax sp.]